MDYTEMHMYCSLPYARMHRNPQFCKSLTLLMQAAVQTMAQHNQTPRTQPCALTGIQEILVCCPTVFAYI